MLRYDVHGIHVSVTSNWTRFLELVSMNYAAFSRLGAMHESLEVSVDVRKKKWVGDSRLPTGVEGKEERWGTHAYRDAEAVRYKSDRIWVEFVQEPPAKVRGSYMMDRRTRLASLYRDTPEWGVCQLVMRLALHLPILHMLERRNVQLLHASAVVSDNKAILISGLNGSGKSSLCFDLLDHFDYMSDNFVFWDGEDVLGFPEAMRIPVGENDSSSADAPMAFGKKLIPIDVERTALRAELGALIFLTLGPETSMAPLPAKAAVHRLKQIHDMTHEFPRYTYIGSLSSPEDPSRLIELTRSVPAFTLAMADVREARSLLLDIL